MLQSTIPVRKRSAKGLGFTIISHAAVDKEARLGDLVRIPLAPRLIGHLWVVYPKERIHAEVVNEFVRFAKGRLAASRGAEINLLPERLMRVAHGARRAPSAQSAR
ncbi:MAG TPA: LysR substrate-binding domain-containing protein [Casimicrobiaceae bacterium]|jgi:hypothetical protein